MTKVTSTITTFLVCLVVAAPAWAQDAAPANVAGKWEMTNETPRGTITSTFTFEQDGNVLTGTVEGRMGTTPISEGSVVGNEITFKVARSTPRGNFEIIYSGTVDGDTITGTITNPRGEIEITMRRVDGL